MVATRTAGSVLCLPLYSDMRDEEANLVVEAVRRVMGSAPKVREATRSKARLPFD